MYFDDQSVRHRWTPDALSASLSDQVPRGVTLYKLYTTVQVNSDSSYLARTGVITLTQGLLFITANTLLKDRGLPFAILAVTAIGICVSIIWLFFEQRNHAFFKARSKFLRQMEEALRMDLARLGEKSYARFWTQVPQLVDTDAKWYERVSAQKILRFWIPMLFIAAWLAVGGNAILPAHRGRMPAPDSFAKRTLKYTLIVDDGTQHHECRASHLESDTLREGGTPCIDRTVVQ